MAGVRKKAIQGGKYQGWFIDAIGKRRFFTGTRAKAEMLRMAQRLEDEHRQVRLGYRPALQSADIHRHRPFAEVKDEYLAWGKSQGGRSGRPWGETHARNRCTHLGWWHTRLSLGTLADLEDILPRVEEALRQLQALGRSGKTLTNYAEALAAFCDWCVQRGYLAQDPLKSLKTFDPTPRTRRRAITPAEISQLLHACASHRRLLLETAFLSGLRANELRNLTLGHLDSDRCGLRLDAVWTKNRRPGFQPLPTSLVHRLHDFCISGEPARLYARFYGRKDAKLDVPENPLLYVPTHTARDLDRDLQAAGIQKYTPDGKLDFHGCRVAYINFVIESGVSVKEAQVLARHATPELTMNVYGRVREERLSEAVEKVAKILFPDEERARYVHRKVVGADENAATPPSSKELRPNQMSGGGGNRTRVRRS
jgi:integrase